jgi:RHS repeat-associated protein
VAGSRAYDPWGTVTATTGSISGLLGFQSAWTDTAAGKSLMGARWYDPGAGDFTSADTVQVNLRLPGHPGMLRGDAGRARAPLQVRGLVNGQARADLVVTLGAGAEGLLRQAGQHVPSLLP